MIARRAAVQIATQSWETLQAARAALPRLRPAVRAAQIALEGTQQEALVGSRTVLDVLIAEQQLFTTQSQLVAAQHDAALAEFNSGGGDRPADRAGAEAAGEALRHGAPLQAGEGQMDRLRRRAQGVTELAEPFCWQIAADLPRLGQDRPAGYRCEPMPDAKSPPEPSMEEILASIRRIIAEDEQSSSAGAAALPLAADRRRSLARSPRR